MTELIIDGVQVVLPKDFAIQVKRENPLITKNGEYTYEITLQLTNPANAELYAHLNRLNNVQEVKTKRSAILIADNRVYCNGTEIVTGWTDDTVSIQIVSGNSELNYFIGSDLQIESLDKMKQTDVSNEDKFAHIEQTYPDVDYCLVPVLDQATETIHNHWSLKTDMSKPVFERKPELVSDGMDIITPQPYLCAYIKELLHTIGYELTLNQLELTPYKNLYICHTVLTAKWNEMLPGWSVKDFLQQVELLFNAVFIVDNRNRTARLLFRASYFIGSSSVHVQQVEDVYEVEVEEPETEDPMTSNVSYKVNDCEFWRWNILPDAIKKGAKYETIPGSVATDMNGIRNWFSDAAHKKTDTIYTHEANGKKYVYLYEFKNVESDPEIAMFIMVDNFADIERENATNTVELEIVPATFQDAGITHYNGGLEPGTDTKKMLFIPCVSDGENVETDLQPKSIEEQIKEGKTQSSISKKNISIAFYTGYQTIYNILLPLNYPLPYIDEYTRHFLFYKNTYWDYVKTNDIGASLRLSALNSLLYSSGYDIDYTKAVRIRSHDPNVYATNLVFEIRNKRYICKEIEYTIDASGRKGAWAGIFYPIRISDTEADLRWILTDGKWRDGGVWLDNGRWLDD